MKRFVSPIFTAVKSHPLIAPVARHKEVRPVLRDLAHRLAHDHIPDQTRATGDSRVWTSDAAIPVLAAAMARAGYVLPAPEILMDWDDDPIRYERLAAKIIEDADRAKNVIKSGGVFERHYLQMSQPRVAARHPDDKPVKPLPTFVPTITDADDQPDNVL